jgi:5-bromo-4-chloroindolyl phosphate hydrolysis protein
MLTEGKPIVQCTLEEVVDSVVKKMNEKYEPEAMTTSELKRKTGYSDGRLTQFHKMGLKKLGNNKWDYKYVRKWLDEERPKIMRQSKKKK